MKLAYPFRKNVSLSFFLLLFSMYSYSQSSLSGYDISTDFRNYWPASVSASGLFSKPAEEMDYATGRATIRIPLYEIRTADFVLPISIYFTTSGIEKNQLAGQIGTGWRLEAEPMISRQVRGAPDEFYFLADSARRRQNNEFYPVYLATGQADIQQDIFHYRLLSGSSSFILDESAKRYFRPRLFTTEKTIISVPSGQVGSSFDNSIFIIDPSGNRYVFGAENSSREHTFQGNGESVTAWKASEITSVNGDCIRFSYWDRAPQEYPYSRYDFYMVEDNYYNQPESDDIPPHPGYWKGVNGKKNYYYVSGTQWDEFTGMMVPIFKKWDKVSDVPYASPGSRVSPRPIQRIDFSGGSVRFGYGTSNGLLEKMDVYSGETIIRSIRFTTASSYLPFLTKVETYGADGKSSGYYYLGYESYREGTTEEQYSSRVGGYSTMSDDDMVPTQEVTIVNSDAYGQELRFSLGNGSTAFFPQYRGENLRFIIYPSGGRTEYSYEYSYARTPDGDPMYRGSASAGPRLSSITDHPISGQPVVRSFKYGDTEALRGVGCARFPVGVSAFSQEYTKHYVVNGIFRKDVVSGRCRLYSNQNMISDDASVYYPFVRETVNGVHTLRHFPCHFSFNYGDDLRFPISIGQGSIASHVDSCVRFRDNNAFSVIYSTYRSSRKTVGIIQTTALFENADNVLYDVIQNVTLRDLYFRSYQINTVEAYQAEPGEVSRREKNLDGSDVANRQENRSYSSSGLLESITTDRERIDFFYPSASPSNSASALMLSLNAVSTPMETRHYVDGALRRRVVYDYVRDNNTHSGYSLSSVRESTDSSDSKLRTMDRYQSYLSCGKPSEVIRPDGLTVGIVWGYGGMHPIAFIEGMSAAAMLSAGISLESVASSHTVSETVYTQLNNLRISHPEVRITTFRYRPMVGVTCRTEPNGLSTTYEYDGLGRLHRVKDHAGKTIEQYEYKINKP